jgi:hypothetical protein
MYEAGKRCDERIFAEQRTNIKLKAGDHYAKKSSKLADELRNRGVINEKQKIRITKNNVHRIVNFYKNHILEGNPSVTAMPFNESEHQDVKEAEMSNSVISWVKDSNNWPKKQRQFVGNFTTLGECFAKVRFDISKGPVIGNDENGKPVHVGEFVIDRIFAFDLKRDPMARDWDECRYVIHEQMIDVNEFKETLKALNKSEKLLDQISMKSSKETMKVFDSSTGKYMGVRNQVFVRELFYKPSVKYPRGYYVMFTEDHVIHEMEIPFGIYPIILNGGFDEQETSPRSTSIIRVARPYQVEVNRSSSKMAEHQITLGDDKVYIQKGTKIANGGYVHGVRAVQVSGQQPIIQEGRTGSQYLDYQLSQVREMYEACNVAFLLEDKPPQGDMFQLLHRTMSEKRRFVEYVQKYESFEIEIFKTVLKMAKKYLRPEHVIKIAGRTEAVNIKEYKDGNDMGFEIKVIPQSGDTETKFGKLIELTQVLQYAGSSMNPDQLGQLVKQLQFANGNEAFSSLTINQDNLQNDILALDRGDQVFVNPEDDHSFMINGLTHRMKKADYRFLTEEIKQRYIQKRQEHEMFFTQQKASAAQASLGMIPSGGFLITCNASWFNPVTKRAERIKVPSQSLAWLVEKLQTQGFFSQELESLPLSAQADIGQLNSVVQAPNLQTVSQPEAGTILPAESRLNGGN